MSLFSKLYVTRAEFLATCKSSQPVLLTRSLTTRSCTGSSSHKLFYSFSRQLSTSNQVAAGSHSSQTLSVAQQSNPTASLVYMWLNRKPNLFIIWIGLSKGYQRRVPSVHQSSLNNILRFIYTNNKSRRKINIQVKWSQTRNYSMAAKDFSKKASKYKIN